MKKLSVVIPFYNEEKMLRITYNTISSILRKAGINYEIIFVNDGSKDKTWNEIQNLCKKFNDVEGVNFSRNFGKESAVSADLANAIGDCVAVMDCDLQHPPETLIEMYNKWFEGY
ncbi:MAG: glycosyltransferase family 2 protein [Clostridioides sp.]|jgi:dolichol-phosphate mannosyltransferase|nr:glycosyltransferase family 2 protein [Clostridioides sp.]